MRNLTEIMSREVACTTPDSSLVTVARLMVDCNCGEIPVVEDYEVKKVIGVITDRDIVCRTIAQGKNPMNLKARDCMSSPVIAATTDMSLDDCINLMEDNRIRRLPILSAQGHLTGIVSQADLIRQVEGKSGRELLETGRTH